MKLSQLSVGSTYKDTISGKKVVVISKVRTNFGWDVKARSVDFITKKKVIIDIKDGQLVKIIEDDIEGF